MCALVAAQPARVAAFVQRVCQEGSAVKGAGVRSRWFDSAGGWVAALARGEAEAVRAFQDDVRVYASKTEASRCF